MKSGALARELEACERRGFRVPVTAGEFEADFKALFRRWWLFELKTKRDLGLSYGGPILEFVHTQGWDLFSVGPDGTDEPGESDTILVGADFKKAGVETQ